MQDKGLTNFASVEEFKRAFLSAHEACLESGKKVISGDQQLQDNEKAVKESVNEYQKSIERVSEFFQDHRATLNSSLRDQLAGEDPSAAIKQARESAQLFSQIERHNQTTQSLVTTLPLEPSVRDQLQQLQSQVASNVQDVTQTLSQVRQQEDKFYSRIGELQAQQRAEQLELEAQALAAQARRKSLKKKLMWTAGFVLVVAGFIKSQMM
ncbi:hypothetical protein [Vibrio rhodolitus]|uniref:hypothetical protein n=1 Tax=Vibrio rhodolitus TaxID=2231649 RepID=UPI000E0C4F48|nr:hypothetical protein [Vibrio rhodolitus]